MQFKDATPVPHEAPPRARLNARLERAGRFPVTLLVAPAGFGKSTVVRQYLQQAGIQPLSLTLTAGQGTPAGFVAGLGRALAASDASATVAGLLQRILGDEDSDDVATALAELLRSNGTTVFIDDLHYVAGDARLVKLLTHLVRLTKDTIKWIFAARSDADLPIASWVAYGIADIPVGEDDLRLRSDEASLAAVALQQLADPGEVESLRLLVDGWPAAFAIALRAHVHAADLRQAAHGTREMIYRYLAEQVFNDLPGETQRFLVRSCVYPSIDAQVARAVGASEASLSELQRQVSFFVQAPDGRYRYHELFRDFLEHRLRMLGDQDYRDALDDAAAFLELRGDHAEALRACVRSQNTARLAQLVNDHGFALFDRGETDALDAAIAALCASERVPPAVLGLRAMLDAARGHFEVARPSFEAAIAQSGGTFAIALTHRYAIELVRHDYDCIDVLQRTLAREMNDALRVPILGTLATALARADRIDDAQATVDGALALVESTNDDDLRARIYQQAAFVYQFTPHRERAKALAERAASLAGVRGLHEVAARAYSVIYTIVYDEGDLIQALQVLEKLDDAARRGASQQARLFGMIAAYGVYCEIGDEAAMERVGRDLERMHTLLPQARAEALVPAQATRAAWNGEFERAYRLLASAPLAGRTPRQALRAAELALFAFAAGLHAEGDTAETLAVASLVACDPDDDRAIRARVFLALAEMTRGHLTASNRHLTDAEKGLPSRHGRVYELVRAVRLRHRTQLGHDETEALAAATARLRELQLGGLVRLIDALPAVTPETSAYSSLTATERDVLTMLAAGASSKTIAQKTGRSPQTIDTHVRAICRKLRCNGRREAVALAARNGWV